MKALAPMIAIGIVALAATADAAPVWTGAAKVVGIFAGASTSAIGISGLPNAAGCANSDVSIYRANVDVQKTLTIATAAMLSGRKLRCFVDGCIAGENTQKGPMCKLE